MLNKRKLKLGKIKFEYTTEKDLDGFARERFILKFVNADEIIDEYEKIKRFIKSFDIQ